MTLTTGAILNQRYRIINVIAQGGMGAIYCAQDETLGLIVAVKENLFNQSDYSRQFRREATILASLRHPNLPRVTDHFSLEGQGQYLIMDYIEGEDLRHRLQRSGPISEFDALSIGIAICDALSYLHSRIPPILHRDIKPGNIRVDKDGHVFLVDFGLAKRVEVGKATTVGAQSLTPGYAPPEQYGRGTDERSDIYSLAATLYAAMTDRIPEDGLARAMGNAHLTALRTRNPRISEQTAYVIERGLAIQPDQRYQSAQDFRQALVSANTHTRKQIEDLGDVRISPPPADTPKGMSALMVNPPADSDHQEDTPVPPIDISYLEQLRPAAPKRSKWLYPGIAGSILVGLILIGSLMIKSHQTQANHPSTTAEVGVSVTAVTTENSAAATDGTEITPETTEDITIYTEVTSEENGKIAFASDRTGIPQVWIMDADGKNQHQLTMLSDGACQPDWSPNDERLVFISPCPGKKDTYVSSSMYLINADGTGIVPLKTEPGGDFEPTWSPNGEKIAFTSVREGIPHVFVYDLTDDSVIGLSRPSSFDRYPVWSPDSTRLAFTTTRMGLLQIWIMNADGTEPDEFTSISSGVAYMPTWSLDGTTIAFSHGTGLSILMAQTSVTDSKHQFPVNEKVRPVYDPVFSPDSKWIAFEGNPNGDNLDIYKISPNGTNLTQLTNNPAKDFDPDW